MGNKQINVAGKARDLDENTTIAELKEHVGASANDIPTYKDTDGSWVTLSDRDQLKHVPDETTVAFQPPAKFGRGD